MPQSALARMIVLSFTLVLALTHGNVTRADTLYATGFEPPFYTGALAGQDGWTSSDNASTIVTEGSNQLLKINGPDIPGSPGFYSGIYSKFFNLDPLSLGKPQISVNADVRLDLGPNAATTPWLYAFFLVRDPSGNAAFATLGIGKDGTVFGQNFNDLTPNGNEVVVSPTSGAGAYHNLRMDLDFNTRQINFLMDGSGFGTLAFNNAATNTLGTIDFVLQSGSPIDSTLRVDNVSLTGTPEPCSISMLGVAAISFLGCAWRRRKRTAQPHR